VEHDRERPVSAAPAADPALPSLKEDNCIRAQRRKQLFVAQENLRRYIEKFGVNHVGVLTITTSTECWSSVAFQKKWHSFRSNIVVRLFATGMWVRERQPRTGNWHCHAIVNFGHDIRTSFPFDQVEHRFYANVDPALRAIWKQLRQKAEVYGFGRTELLPIRQNAAGCSRYLTKYLSKSFVTEKAFGEEKGRLFGVWGKVRFVHSGFDWVANRIMRKRKAWLAATADLNDIVAFTGLYGPRWWLMIGDALMKVIMPVEYYQIQRNGSYEWDDIGWFAYQRDLGRYTDLVSDEARRRQSLFDFYCAEGAVFHMSPSQAARYAMNRIGYLERDGREVDPQMIFDLEAAIERTRKNSSS
jgi:hypothetical protein